MPKLTRETFVAICKQAIEMTRKKIAIRNQVSGYIKYHKAIRDNDYFNAFRKALSELPEEPALKHDFIEHCGIGISLEKSTRRPSL